MKPETPVSQSQLSQWMTHAIGTAKQALPDDVPVGCIIVDDSHQVIAEGCNRRELDNSIIAHAEMLAIQQANEKLGQWRLQHCTLIVTLEPCPMCASAIIQAKIGRVVFGAWDAVVGALGSATDLRELYWPAGKASQHRLEVIGGIEEVSCKALLTSFFEEKR
jgi:tRNA(adenine34) deaminase